MWVTWDARVVDGKMLTTDPAMVQGNTKYDNGVLELTCGSCLRLWPESKSSNAR